MKKALLLLLFVHFVFGAYSQAPAIQWEKSLGGSSADNPQIMEQTNDGGYIIAGASYSNDGQVTGHHGDVYDADYWIVKIDSFGNIQWEKSLGGSNVDEAMSIQQTVDGGYIVAGDTWSTDGDVTGNHGINDYWVVKLDSGGIIQWEKCLGGSGWDEAYSIQQTIDGGYIVAGYSYSSDDDVTGHHPNDTVSRFDYWIVKLDSAGKIQWEKSLGGSEDDEAFSIRQTTDEGYIVAGYSNSNDGDVTGNHGDGDYWIVKLDSLGIIKWQKCLGGSGNDEAFFVEQTSDLGYIIAGSTDSNDGDVTGNHGGGDCWIVKLDSVGGIQWEKCLGGSEADVAFFIHQTHDGGYIIAGSSDSHDGDLTNNYGLSDYWIVKIDSIGKILWQKSMGGSADDQACSIQQVSDSIYMVAGSSGSNDHDVTGNHGNFDYWIVKLGPSIATGIVKANTNNSFSLQPNPCNGSFEISFNNLIENGRVEITDAMGRVAYSVPSVNNGNNIPVSLNDVATGIYFVRVFTSEEVQVRKLMVVR